MDQPELIAPYYPSLLLMHIALVSVSVALFVARGVSVLAGKAWPMSAWSRRGSALIDTTLLIAGCTLWWLLQLNPLYDRWLGMKLLLLPIYIVLGSFAIKRARSRASEARFFVGALVCVAFMAGIALAHVSWGFLTQ